MQPGALILTAGLSSRMDGFKPLLEIRGKSLLEHAINLFRDAGVEEIVTVVGYRSQDLVPVISRTASRHVVNEHYEDGMFSSIRKGAAVLQSRCDAFFLLPVDIPCVKTGTVRQLLETYRKNPANLICYPEFEARRGHPPLIAARLIDGILAYNGHDGMRGFLRMYEDRAVNVPVEDPFVRLDVDTRQDFLRLEAEIQTHRS